MVAHRFRGDYITWPIVVKGLLHRSSFVCVPWSLPRQERRERKKQQEKTSGCGWCESHFHAPCQRYIKRSINKQPITTHLSVNNSLSDYAVRLLQSGGRRKPEVFSIAASPRVKSLMRSPTCRWPRREWKLVPRRLRPIMADFVENIIGLNGPFCRTWSRDLPTLKFKTWHFVNIRNEKSKKK